MTADRAHLVPVGVGAEDDLTIPPTRQLDPRLALLKRAVDGNAGAVVADTRAVFLFPHTAFADDERTIHLHVIGRFQCAVDSKGRGVLNVQLTVHRQRHTLRHGERGSLSMICREYQLYVPRNRQFFVERAVLSQFQRGRSVLRPRQQRPQLLHGVHRLVPADSRVLAVVDLVQRITVAICDLSGIFNDTALGDLQLLPHIDVALVGQLGAAILQIAAIDGVAISQHTLHHQRSAGLFIAVIHIRVSTVNKVTCGCHSDGISDYLAIGYPIAVLILPAVQCFQRAIHGHTVLRPVMDRSGHRQLRVLRHSQPPEVAGSHLVHTQLHVGRNGDVPVNDEIGIRVIHGAAAQVDGLPLCGAIQTAQRRLQLRHIGCLKPGVVDRGLAAAADHRTHRLLIGRQRTVVGDGACAGKSVAGHVGAFADGQCTVNSGRCAAKCPQFPVDRQSAVHLCGHTDPQ